MAADILKTGIWDFKGRVEKASNSLRLTDFPIQIILEMIAGCNLRCPACPSPILERPKGLIKIELMEKVISEIASVDAENTELYPAYMGEALTHRRIFDILKFGNSLGLKKIFLNTNGMLLTDETIESLLKCPPAKIIVSIDGHSKETYEARRVGGKYDKVKNNTLRLLKRNSEMGKPTEIWTQMILDEGNQHEINEFREFWVNSGATVKIRTQLTWGGRVGENYLSGAEVERIPCPWLMRQLVVAYDGEAILCDADHEAKLNLGNINDKSIKEIWQSEFRKRQEQHLRGDFSAKICAECHDWKVGKSMTYRPSDAR